MFNALHKGKQETEFSKNLMLKQLKIKGPFLFFFNHADLRNETLSLAIRGLISNARKTRTSKISFKIHYFRTKHLTLLEVSFLTCKMRGK